MIDQFTYDLLKRIHECPISVYPDRLDTGRFASKYRAIYGDLNQIGKLLSQLKSLGYLEIPKGSVDVIFTQNGFDVVKEYDNALRQNDKKTQLEYENLRLQNEQLHYQNQIRDMENEIRQLSLKNLKLQNKELKNKVIYAILGVVGTLIVSNLKDILIMLQIIDKQ